MEAIHQTDRPARPAVSWRMRSTGTPPVQSGSSVPSDGDGTQIAESLPAAGLRWILYAPYGGDSASNATVAAGVVTFFKINLVRMFCLGGFAGPEPSLSIACCAGPDPTTRSRNSSAMAEFYPNV